MDDHLRRMLLETRFEGTLPRSGMGLRRRKRRSSSKKPAKRKSSSKKSVKRRSSSKKSVKRASTRSRGAGMNPWLKHLAAYRKAHPNVHGADVMKRARASYKPMKAGVRAGVSAGARKRRASSKRVAKRKSVKKGSGTRRGAHSNPWLNYLRRNRKKYAKAHPRLAPKQIVSALARKYDKLSAASKAKYAKGGIRRKVASRKRRVAKKKRHN